MTFVGQLRAGGLPERPMIFPSTKEACPEGASWFNSSCLLKPKEEFPSDIWLGVHQCKTATWQNAMENQFYSQELTVRLVKHSVVILRPLCLRVQFKVSAGGLVIPSRQNRVVLIHKCQVIEIHQHLLKKVRQRRNTSKTCWACTGRYIDKSNLISYLFNQTPIFEWYVMISMSSQKRIPEKAYV
jgi:hypothetical protein